MARLHIWHDDIEISDRDHDYDPAWDYELIPPPEGRLMQQVAGAMAQIERDVLPVLDVKDAVVFFGEEDTFGGNVGLYVNGTSSYPFIGLDIATLHRMTEPEDFQREVIATLVHELGHAYLDDVGIDETGGGDFEEAVEEFAQHYLETGEVDSYSH